MHDIALIFHDFPGLETGLPKFHDFARLSRTSGHPMPYPFDLAIA